MYGIESARLDRAATAQAEQEIAEFRTLQEQGKDPNTARDFASIRDLMRVFLERNVPSDNELFVAWVDDKAAFVSASDHRGFGGSDELAALVARHVEDGAEFRADSSVGELLITVQPVHGQSSRGALVVVTFLDDMHADLTNLMRTYAIFSLLSLGVITMLAGWQAGRLLAPLRQMSETAREISVTDLSRRLPETGNDDISALTRTVNEMLARLEESFTTQRQFLDSAGHELRTPLTILRGHLEVLDEDNPAEVAETRDMLLDEIDRMARLVNDLILLTKSNRPDFITPGPVDLDALVSSVVTKARGLGVREWQVDATTDGVLLHLDEQRITQALLQLADNAVKHTHPGDVIAVGASVDHSDGTSSSTVRLWVRDAGHGVEPGDRERIFERFSRSAVLPGDEGFGLGLSIVRAIASAHGGTVHVEDAEPTGATFVLTLPFAADTVTEEEESWPAS
nr:HAMP domain-containing sensor histidine kinase [Nocardioides daedukensis]